MNELTRWFGGPVCHTHLRIDNDSPEYQPTENLQFMAPAFIEYLQLLTGDKNVLTIDTDHPAVYLDPDYSIDDVKPYFYPDRIEATIQDISIHVSERADLIRKDEVLRSSIITGTEVDIIGPTGELDVTDKVLGELGVVIASFHFWDYMIATRQSLGSFIALDEIINAYEGALNNLNVDVIGHPTREIREYNRSIEDIPKWEKVFKKMRDNNILFEINLASLKGCNKEQLDYEFEIMQYALQHGVQFIFGFDFHNIDQFVDNNLLKDIVDSNNVKSSFEFNKGESNFKFFMFLRRTIKRLEQLGFKPNDIKNSNYNSFELWRRDKMGTLNVCYAT